MKITKTTSSKTVNAYQSRAPQRIDGAIVVIEAYSRSLNDHGTYDHSMRVRPATAAETLTVETAESIAAMGRRLDELKEAELDHHIAGTTAAWRAEYLPLQKQYIAAKNA